MMSWWQMLPDGEIHHVCPGEQRTRGNVLRRTGSSQLRIKASLGWRKEPQCDNQQLDLSTQLKLGSSCRFKWQHAWRFEPVPKPHVLHVRPCWRDGTHLTRAFVMSLQSWKTVAITENRGTADVSPWLQMSTKSRNAVNYFLVIGTKYLTEAAEGRKDSSSWLPVWGVFHLGGEITIGDYKVIPQISGIRTQRAESEEIPVYNHQNHQ